MTAYDDTHIPYLVTFALDMMFLIPFLVVTILLSQPLSGTTCSDLPNKPGRVLLSSVAPANKTISYEVFSGAAGQTTCYELMAVWGLMITLCILFATSAISAGFLYLGKRRAMPPSGVGRFPMNDSQIEMALPKRSFSQSSRSEPHQFNDGGFDAHNAPGGPGRNFNGRFGQPRDYEPGSPTSDHRPDSPAGSFDGQLGGLSSPPARHNTD